MELMFDTFPLMELGYGEITQQSENKPTSYMKDHGTYYSSSHIEILDKVEAGVYKVGTAGNELCWKKHDLFTDELYLLHNDSIEDLFVNIKEFIDKKELFKKHKIVHKRGLLLEGPKGTGKSSISYIIANKLIKEDNGLVFIIENSNEFKNTMRVIRDLIRPVEPDRPIFIIMEDLDSYDDIFKEIAEFLDGKNSIEHVLTLFTTNNSKEIPGNILRASRIDLRYVITNPDYETRLQFLRAKGLEEDKAKEIAELTENKSLADLKDIFIAIEIFGHTIEECISKKNVKAALKNYMLENKAGSLI